MQGSPADANGRPDTRSGNRADDGNPAGLTYESEGPIGAPEAAHAEHHALVTVGKRRLDGSSEDRVWWEGHVPKIRRAACQPPGALSHAGLRSAVMSVGRDLRGYTDFVEQRGAADPQAADGAGDWDLIKQQDFGPPT